MSRCRTNYATACAFRFLRQPSKPKLPMPVARSGGVAGSGVGAVPEEPLNVPVPLVVPFGQRPASLSAVNDKEPPPVVVDAP